MQDVAREAVRWWTERTSRGTCTNAYGSLAANRHPVGKPLRFELEGLHSARRGDFRIVYRITHLVTIIAVEDRADVYRPRCVRVARSYVRTGA